MLCENEPVWAHTTCFPLTNRRQHRGREEHRLQNAPLLHDDRKLLVGGQHQAALNGTLCNLNHNNKKTKPNACSNERCGSSVENHLLVLGQLESDQIVQIAQIRIVGDGLHEVAALLRHAGAQLIDALVFGGQLELTEYLAAGWEID